MAPRIVMHQMDAEIARHLARLLNCEVTLSMNHPPDKITLCGFNYEYAFDQALAILRTEAPEWYVRIPEYG